MAVTKHNTFATALRANGIGEEGNEKPNSAQIEKDINTAAKLNKV